ncbi:MAG: thiolase family protein, partial [Deltaproteobacteria bacterium]
MNKVFIVGYHQSPFGKLFDMTLEQAFAKAANGVLESVGATPEDVDTISVAACCAPLLNDQMLLSGLVADAPGFAGKSIDTAENACASGGQALLNVAYRLMAGAADVGLVIGVEKMRDDAGKMDGKLVGKALGTASHPEEREGKTFVFPHIFAEIMEKYIATHEDASEELLAHVAETHYGHANKNPLAQMKKVEVTAADVMDTEGRNRYIVPGLPLKTYDASQISDGYAALLVCNSRGLEKLNVPKDRIVELAGFAQRTDPLMSSKRDDILKPRGAYDAVAAAYEMAGITADNVSVAEVHDCFSVMGAIAVEIIGKAEYGKGARYYADGKAKIGGGATPINTSGGLMAKGHPVGATGVAMPGWCYQQLVGDVPS